MMKSLKLTVFICASITIFGLSACGVKPPYVEPPEGAEHSDFPNTYPNPNTDPQPGLENR